MTSLDKFHQVMSFVVIVLAIMVVVCGRYGLCPSLSNPPPWFILWWERICRDYCLIDVLTVRPLTLWRWSSDVNVAQRPTRTQRKMNWWKWRLSRSCVCLRTISWSRWESKRIESGPSITITDCWAAIVTIAYTLFSAHTTMNTTL